jgi:hypothetical protein
MSERRHLRSVPTEPVDPIEKTEDLIFFGEQDYVDIETMPTDELVDRFIARRNHPGYRSSKQLASFIVERLSSPLTGDADEHKKRLQALKVDLLGFDAGYDISDIITSDATLAHLDDQIGRTHESTLQSDSEQPIQLDALLDLFELRAGYVLSADGNRDADHIDPRWADIITKLSS